MQRIYIGQLVERVCSGVEIIPPPRGALGCGASMIAIPGVNIWPLIILCAFKPPANRERSPNGHNRSGMVGINEDIGEK